MPKKKTKKKKAIKKEKKESITDKSRIVCIFLKERVITENSNEARELFNLNRFGSMTDDNRVQLSLIETMYLLEKGKIAVVDGRNNDIVADKFLKKALKLESNFWIKYCVFKDMRNRGYIVKTAMKFGADFRVYDRGVKPGEDHAKWVVFPVHETSSLTWYEFSAKNRVAHSTRKRLLIGCVDEENDVTYWEIRWIRP